MPRCTTTRVALPFATIVTTEDTPLHPPMNQTSLAFLGAVALLAVTGCSNFSKTARDSAAEPSGGGGGGKGLAGNMAEAAVFGKGETLNAAAECHTSGYMKMEIPAGEPFQIDLTIDSPADTCLSVHYLKANGGAVDGMMLEICSPDSPRTIDVTGQEGGSFLQISEAGVCQGAKVGVAIR